MADLASNTPASGSYTLRELVERLLRQWALMSGVTVVVVGVVTVGTLLMAPRYESAALLRLVEQSPQSQLIGDQLSGLPGAGLLQLGQDELDTEVGVLRSWRVSEAVVDSLALTVRVEKPLGSRRAVLTVLSVGDPDVEAELRFERLADGGYQATVEPADEDERVLGTVAPGEVVTFGGYRLAFDPRPDREGRQADEVVVEIVPRYVAIDELREDLRVRKHEGGARLVDVAYRSTDRELAAEIVNTAVRVYVRYKNRAENSDAVFRARELRRKVAEYEERLAEAEERLRRFQESARIIAPEEEAIQQVRRVAEIQLQRDALRVERNALADLLRLIDGRSADPADAGRSSSRYRQLATFPTLISNGAIQDVLTALLDLENERAELLVLRTLDNADVRQLTERIEELEQQLFRLGRDYLESLEGHLRSIDDELADLDEALGTFPEREMQYIRLARDREVLGEAYVMLQEQLGIAEVQEAVRSEGIRVVDDALVAHEDDVEFPKLPVNLFLGLVLGLSMGLVAAVARDAWTSP